MHARLSFEKKLSHTSLIRYQSPEKYCDLNWSPQFLLIWCFIIPEIVGTLWLSKILALPGLLHQSWVTCTNTCGIELWIKLSRTTLIGYRSSTAIWYFLTQRLVKPSCDFFKILAVTGLLPCGFPHYDRVGRCAPARAGLSFENSFLIQPWSDIGHPQEYSGLNR